MPDADEEAVIDVAGVWRTTAAPQAVWDVLADLRSWSRWWPAVREVRVVEDGAGGLPARADLVFDAPSPLRSLEIPIRVVEVDPPQMLTVQADGSGFAGNGALIVTADEGGSAVDYRFGLRTTRPWLKPVDLVLAGATRGPGRARLARAGDDLAELAGGLPRDHDPPA